MVRFHRRSLLLTPLLLNLSTAFAPLRSSQRFSSLAMADKGASGHKPPKSVVIAGAGVVGTTTAYYLAKEHGIKSILVDPSGAIAPAASGKAGGFLALDWNDYSPVGPLARRSFALHQELADTLGADKIQYRRLTCVSIGVDSEDRPSGKKLEGVEWAEASSTLGMRPLGGEDTIAQVHPKKLCQSLFEATKEMIPETELVQGKVVSAAYDENDKEEKTLVGAKLEDGTTLASDALLYACGPWTPGDVMTGIKYHSLVVPTDKILSQCVFFSGCGDPEVYVRPDSTAYCTGFPDPPVVVTEEPGQEEVRPDAIEKIRSSVQQASAAKSFQFESSSSSSEKHIKNACYLPSPLDSTPIMGKINGKYISAGHGCWGILMGPASGEAMASLIATGKSPHVDLSPFSPSRFGNRLQI